MTYFAAHKNNHSGLMEMKSLIEKLPASSYQLLKYLCKFLVRVSMNEGNLPYSLNMIKLHSFLGLREQVLNY